VFLQPGILILDEPTNHINFRHIPVIAKALDEFK
jgi:ATP-binding cassette subfamily F protein 3